MDNQIDDERFKAYVVDRLTSYAHIMRVNTSVLIIISMEVVDMALSEKQLEEIKRREEYIREHFMKKL